jgi:hypothetical protein
MNTTIEAPQHTITVPTGARVIIVTSQQPKTEFEFKPSFPEPPDHWYYDLTGLTLRGARSMADDLDWAATVLRRLDEFRFEVRVMMDRWRPVDRIETFDVRKPIRGWWTWSAMVPRRCYRRQAA